MKVATGKVIGGKVVLEGEPLALLAAIDQAERGEVISWEELRERLRRSG